MKCPNCGNELDQDEVFCGQCGSSIRPAGLPTEMVQTPPVRSGQLNNTFNSQPPSYPAGALPPDPNQSALRSPGPRQQNEFYKDETEAMSVLPNSGQNYPAGYPQQGYPGIPVQGGMPPVMNQYGQPMQSGNYASSSFPQAPVYQAGQYGSRPEFTPPPKRSNSVALVIAIICLACAIIAASAFGILYLVHKNNTNTASTPTPAVTATTIPTSSLSPTPTPTLTPSPSLTPSPTVSPTPSVTPITGYSFCGTTCTANGFQVEYPATWSETTPDSMIVKFDNPMPTDVYAIFKAQGATSNTVDTLISSDLTSNYASNPGYIGPTPNSSMNMTFGGASWTYETATYTLNNATEQIQVYATVYKGNAYIIELQASAAQFTMTYNQYFMSMLTNFQFLT